MGYTDSAARSAAITDSVIGRRVVRTRQLLDDGWSRQDVRTNLAARRWQRIGRVIVLHNDEPSRRDVLDIARLNTSPRALWTAFTAAEVHGLQGWYREPVHLLVPDGVAVKQDPIMPIRVHRGRATGRAGGCEALPAALIRAASSLESPRSACGVLAAGVQQRLVLPSKLKQQLLLRVRTRHRAVLLHAVDDIAQGAEALSEIDFAALCRQHKLPAPVRQVVRADRSGRRRYVDAEWLRADGRRVIVEIDGALHLVARRWWDDQLRQNELVLDGAIVLRFPSVVLRTEPDLVAKHLRRALDG